MRSLKKPLLCLAHFRVCRLFSGCLLYFLPLSSVKRGLRIPLLASAHLSLVVVVRSREGWELDRSWTMGSRAENYDVFLNFRVTDSLDLVDPLCHRMTDAGLWVFRDDDELSVGEEISPSVLRAIQGSKIYIPIFSKNYASSSWCLRELAHMVRLRSESDGEKVILPIFIDVGPSDVGLRTGLYDEGLLKLAEKFGSDVTGEWRNALIEAANIKGWKWDRNPKSLGGLVDLVVEEVLKMVEVKMKKLHVGNLVGMDVQVQDVMHLLDVGGRDVHFVGIWGMGGIGKTVLAKSVFNQLHSRFEGCSFLADIREFSRRAGLVACQKRLLQDITRCEPTSINSIDEGIMFIKRRLSNKKVLLVLDDIDDEFQLRALAGDRHWFGFGSRIIITTRDRHVLDRPDPILTYEMTNLNDDEAFQLFNMHAFGRVFPPEDWYALSREVVSCSGGLPLALEVLGSLLHGKSKAAWEGALEKMKVVPLENVMEKLKISYNSLEYSAQQIFLDIACFFVNKNVTDANYMWWDCNFHPMQGIRTLVDSYLIKILDDRTIWMHDQLIILGKEIVRQQNPDPGKQSRVWHREDALELIRSKRKNLERVEALSLAGDPTRSIITNEEFAGLWNLRLLELEGAILDGDFKNLLPQLRYLSWRLCPEEFKATSLYLPNLVVLILSEGHITDNWGGWSQIKGAKKLKVLDLTGCQGITKMPDLSGFLRLERLILCNCLKLGTVDSSIGKLKCLIYLNLKGCINLQGLLEGIGDLVNLWYLDLDGCSKLTELPSNMGDLKSLRELNISDTGIQVLPDSLEKFKKLTVISNKKDQLSLLSAEEPKRPRDELSEKLEGVNPNRKGRLSFLTTLKLSDSSDSCIYAIPSVIIELVNLLTLDLKDCHKLQQLPKLPKSLEHLKLPLSLRSVLNILDLIKLVDLLLFDGSEDLSFHASNLMLTSLQWIRKLNKQGNLESCLVDILAPSIKLSSLSWLNKLSLLRQGLQSLIWLSSFLSVLAFGHLCSTNMWSYISSFKNSSNLWFYQYDDEEIQLHELEGLRKLTLENCEPLQRVSNLSIWKNLKELSLIRCPQLVELQNLGGFESLEKLHVKLCQSLERLIGLSNLRKLKVLIIEECDALRDVEGLDELYSLSSLKIWNCSMLKHLTGVSNSKIPDACEVIIWKCGELRDFCHIGHGLAYKHYREAVLGMTGRDSGSDLAKRLGKMSNMEESMEKMEDEATQREADMETSDRNYAIAAVQKLVGIDDRVKLVTELLEMEVIDEVRIIGIYGTDGIGKTTLAKAVYDRISSCFDSCCFLAEVEETTQNPRGIQLLQNKLICDILERDREDPSFDKRIEDFLDIFREMKVLIVVDDVKEQFHLHAIVGDQLHRFGPGSRIIVTSQNEEVLKEYDQARTYMVGKLDDGEAFELFFQHAFGEQSPIPGNDGHINSIVNATEILPLAIEVIGSFLRGRPIQEWEKMEESMKPSTMSSRKTTVGLEEILDICYEELDQQQKDIFLDIAFFVSGVDARIASYMWPNSHLPSSNCILIPLAKIGKNNELQMHRLLRCLGKRKKEESPDPSSRRFWTQDMVLKAMNGVEGIENVEARDSCILTAANFASMPAISFLKLDDAKVSGNFEGAFPSLRWFCWQRVPLDFGATDFVLTELVIFDLSWSKVTEDWGGWSEIKMEKLKVLNLTGCSDLLFTPDFSGYKDLEILILERCSRLVKLDPSISHLKHLVSLNLRFCSQLNGLPVELGCMTALKELFIDGTSVREIPISTGNLKQLKILSGFKCFPLTHLPSSISYLPALSELSLEGAKITELPSSLGNLLNLRRLLLRDCRYLEELPYSIGKMGRSLKELDISGTRISELPNSIRNLQSLTVLRMDSSLIRAFPKEIGNLTKLEELHASWCWSLKGAIPREFKRLHHLRSLKLGHSSISSLPSEISTLSSLHTLDLLQCNEIEVLPELPPSLICLRVSSKRMKAIPLLKDLKELEELYLSDEDPEERQPPSTQLMPESKVKQLSIWSSRLWNLELFQSQRIKKKSFSISFPKLRKLELSLSRIIKLQFVYEPTDIPQLKTLKLSGLSLEEVSELPETLSVLSIRGCSSLKRLPIVQCLTNISAFELYHSAIKEIKGLEGLKALKRLDISNCKIQNLNGIDQLTSLRSLILSDCDDLRLPDLSKLKSLKVLEIRRCKMIHQIKGVEKLSLEKLNISECLAENSV